MNPEELEKVNKISRKKVISIDMENVLTTGDVEYLIGLVHRLSYRIEKLEKEGKKCY